MGRRPLRANHSRNGYGQEVSGEMSNGVVKWFSSKKGYGFITMEDGQEVFVHYTSIDGNGFRSLEQGEEVQFEVAQGPKGLQAAKVLRR
jgi:CspA family cold shock protein